MKTLNPALASHNLVARIVSDADSLLRGAHPSSGAATCAARPPAQTCRARSVAPPYLAILLCALGFAAGFTARVGAQPLVYNVNAAQQAPPSKWVGIKYGLSDPNSTTVNIAILVSKDSGATWTVPASTFTGDYGANVSVTPSAAKAVQWNAGADWDGHFTTNCRVRVLANDQGLSVIPGGTFSMGDALDGEPYAPVHSVTISNAFYMDSTLVTGGKWNLVVDASAQPNGYDISDAQPGAASGPAFKALNHPVVQVTWYDAVKWCNARSQMEGLTPCYFTDPQYNAIYKSGVVEFVNVNTNANGYRLPTEAQWEKAVRGGLSGQRFPWGNNITESRANYAPGSGQPYDLGGPQTSATGAQPWTSPVGSFLPPNGYGLFDMAGNVQEWCWDFYGSAYYISGQIDPQGPIAADSGDKHVSRGGSWFDNASLACCPSRYFDFGTLPNNFRGFRCVRGL